MLTEQVLPVDKVAELGPKVAQALGTKGGGRPGAFQGKASSLDGLPEALKILHQSVQQSSRGSIGYAVSHTWHTVLMPRHACCRFLGAAPDASAFALDWKADCSILQAGVFADYQSAVTRWLLFQDVVGSVDEQSIEHDVGGPAAYQWRFRGHSANAGAYDRQRLPLWALSRC